MLGCGLGFLARIALLFVWITTPLVQRGFSGGWVLPLLGIFFLPMTTLAYVIVFALNHGVTGLAWLWVVLAFFFDVGVHGTSGKVYQQRAKTAS